ncbi:MAG: hypothetical protein H0W72_15935 [Planctomycetes bacterium]|nr:hypothetical protein [Planctomycetota bacterium]
MKGVFLTGLLASVAWLTGNAMLVLVAARLFVVAPSAQVLPAQAGAMFADVLIHWLIVSCFLVTVITLAWLVILARRSASRRLGWDGIFGFLLVSLLIVSHALAWTTTRETERAVEARANARADPATTAAELDVLDQRFQQAHNRNSAWFLIQTLALAALVVVQATTLVRAPHNPHKEASAPPADT